jgi:hypothetical protein
LQETTHVTADKYKATKPDVVMQSSRAILEWMNESKRAIYLKLFCQEYAQVKSYPHESSRIVPARLLTTDNNNNYTYTGQIEDVGEIFMFSVDRKGFDVMAWRQTNRCACPTPLVWWMMPTTHREVFFYA